jgi:ornithine--oxo-acid transaminase
MNIIELENQYCAHNYKPLPIVLVKGQGIYVWDENGKQYMDMMSAYSAISHGHCHPRLVKTLCDQAQILAVASRAFYSNKLAPFLKRLCDLTGYQKALPMNSGAEAVETAIKAARKWAHTVKKIKENAAEIIVCENNFHGRTTTIVSMSSEPQYRFGFGPFTPGFKTIPYDDAAALAKAINPNTAAFLVEPIQGEAGIRIPSHGYLKQCFDLCKQHNVLFIADEIQTGLGRTGKLLACEHENVKPDAVILGKALGGGLLPVSAFLANDVVMNVFTPGDHGSTFGGNPLAAAVASEALNVLVDENLAAHSAELGDYFLKQLQQIKSPLIKTIRGKGLLIGIEIAPGKISARDICLKLMAAGLLSKDTHDTVIRIAPPLVITKKQIDEAMEIIKNVFKN